jgi:hypothetical protein
VGCAAAFQHLGDAMVGGVTGLGGHHDHAVVGVLDAGGDGLGRGDGEVVVGSAGEGEAGDDRVVGRRVGLLGDVITQPESLVAGLVCSAT